MKNHTITTFNRSLASVLLISQLLTSCGGDEVIVRTPEIEAREPIARERAVEESGNIVNRRPSSSVYSSNSFYCFYFYCHLKEGSVEKRNAERLDGLHLPLCIYNPSLKVLKETTQVKTKALEEYHKSTNILEEKLKQNETILDQKKEKLVEQQIKLERLKKVLEEAQNELMDE